MFENPEITLDELPRVETVEWQSMDPGFARRRIVEAVIAFTFVLIGIGGLYTILRIAFAQGGIDFGLGWMWLIPFLVGAPLAAWPLVSVPRMGYALRRRDIVYKSGVFWRTVTAVPFNRIQHVETSSTPLDRRFRVASLQIFTAGGSGGDLKIHGLPVRTAEKLRLFILEKIGAGVDES